MTTPAPDPDRPSATATATATSAASSFPEDFLWGAATSAYQIEGSPLADGAGPSNWHRFSHTPGRIKNGDTGDLACDHYRRWPEDVALMKRLGLNAYRFSISWSRVLPLGTRIGGLNAAGLAFYDRLVDTLLESGIAPNVTLYHWDFPAALDDRGGWLNPDSASWFADYAEIMFKKLGDRVPMWATLNEPWVIVDAGWLHGVHAPGHRSAFEAVRVAHNLLLAHAAAVERFREIAGERRAESGPGATPGKIGIVINLEPKDPASDRPEDIAATDRAEAQMNRQYLDPLFLGRPAEGLAAIYGEAWVEQAAEDYARIARPIDWLGINYYTRGVTRNDDSVWPTRSRTVPVPGATYNTMGWEVHAPSLTRVLLWIKERYGDVPLYVTENGGAFYDPPKAIDGRIDDPLRVAYLRDHIAALAAARTKGADLRGYFVWSLLDNFEWGEGYGQRLGIVHVDYETQKRTVKASGEYYASLIRSRARLR
ncbi:MAG: GH1 family beta-glucosidase [Candidatus Eiseniibacteriota bacterium]